MADEIIGVAVIDRRGNECRGGCEDLHVACKCSDGRVLVCDIPVYADGKPKTLTHQWKYSVSGDRLNMTPSLNWQGVFHNGSSWSVRFVEYDPNEYGSPRMQLKALNPELDKTQ